MSEERNLNDSLPEPDGMMSDPTEMEALLRSLVPRPVALDRDRLFFEAGRAALVGAGASFGPLSRPACWRSARVWASPWRSSQGPLRNWPRPSPDFRRRLRRMPRHRMPLPRGNRRRRRAFRMRQPNRDRSTGSSGATGWSRFCR